MQATWYFDFISPYSYLQLPRILALRERLAITPKPVLFGAILAHFENIGPAEIAVKRTFIYRFIQWQAERAGMTLRFPPAHPFNPMVALRLCVAAATTWPSIQAIFDHLWRDGQAGVTAAELAPVGRALGIADVETAINAPEVKTQLRSNTEDAIALGVFGVPTLLLGDQLFWGNDATPMLEDWLANPRRFDRAEYQRIAHLPIGIVRKR